MKFLKNMKKNKALVLMVLPGFILIFMFAYMPMFGALVALKEYNYADGIIGSPWVGLKNFKFLFVTPQTTWRMLRNTVGYFVLFTVVGTIANVALAIILHECLFKKFARVSQTFIVLPTFISWIAVAYIVEAVLSSNTGMLNNILESLNLEPVNWYGSPKYWPVILLIVNLWKSVGYNSILYLSALSGMDQEVFDAASLDGASKLQQIRYLTLPMLTSMISIATLMGLGGIMTSNTGLFYQVTKNIGLL